MHDISWMLFVVTSLVLIATPGQDMILVMSRSISQGTAAGVATALGVSTGLLGHTVLAGLGLGALLSASDWLFLAVKLIGAAYLIWLGVGLLRSTDSTIKARTETTILAPPVCRRCVLKYLEPQSGPILLCVLAAVRSSPCSAPDHRRAHFGNRVRASDVSPQGTSRPFGWRSVVTAAEATGYPAMDASSERYRVHRAGRQTGHGEKVMTMGHPYIQDPRVRRVLCEMKADEDRTACPVIA